MPKEMLPKSMKRKGFRYDHFEVVGTANQGKIKVLKPKDGENDKFPLFSNRKNTTYFALAKDGKSIGSIGIYRNGSLVESIDFPNGKSGNHWHKWALKKSKRNGKLTPVKDKTLREITVFEPRHERLINITKEITWKK